MESLEGAIVQLNPETCKTKEFGGCLMIVDEEKKWGVVGYITLPDNKHAYYRAEDGEYDVCGYATWMVGQ